MFEQEAPLLLTQRPISRREHGSSHTHTQTLLCVPCTEKVRECQKRLAGGSRAGSECPLQECALAGVGDWWWGGGVQPLASAGMGTATPSWLRLPPASHDSAGPKKHVAPERDLQQQRKLPTQQGLTAKTTTGHRRVTHILAI